MKNSTGRLATWALELLENDYERLLTEREVPIICHSALSRVNESGKPVVFTFDLSQEKLKTEIQDEQGLTDLRMISATSGSLLGTAGSYRTWAEQPQEEQEENLGAEPAWKAEGLSVGATFN